MVNIDPTSLTDVPTMDVNNDGGFFSSVPIIPVVGRNDESIDLFAQAVAMAGASSNSTVSDASLLRQALPSDLVVCHHKATKPSCEEEREGYGTPF